MDTRMEGTGCPPCSSAPNLTPNPSPAPVSAPAYSLASPPPKKPFRLEKGERPAALLCLLMGIVYVRLLLDPPEILRPWGDWSDWLLAILLVSFFVCVELSARLCRLLCPRESWFWAAVMLAQPLGCGLFENDALTLFPFLFSHLAAAQWALVRCGGAAALPVGALLPLDLVRGWFGIPFSNFHRLFQTIFYGAGKKLPKPKSKGVWWGLLGAVCVLPVLVWAFSTLVNADAAFQNLAGSVQDWLAMFSLPAFLADALNPGWLLLELFFACWFYGLFYGSKHLKENTNRIKDREIYDAFDKMRLLPRQTPLVALALLCGLYLVFFLSQLSYLTAGFAGVLPEEYTAAEYARRGFFEMLQIALVNLSVLAAAAKLSRTPLRQSRGLRGLGIALCGSNLLFAAIAFSKLWLYISRFGLTSMRVLAGYAIAVVAIWSALAIASLLRPFGAVVWGVRLAAVLFCLLCLCNIDGLVTATQNQATKEYLQGETGYYYTDSFMD